MLLAAVAALIATITASPASATTVMDAQVVPGTIQVIEVACSTATSCLALGSGPNGYLVVPITNGAPGVVQLVPGNQLSGVACSRPGTCILVGRRSVPRPGMRPGSEGVVVPVTKGIVGVALGVPAVQQLSAVACSNRRPGAEIEDVGARPSTSSRAPTR